MIVKEASSSVSEPTVNSEVITLHGSGVDVIRDRGHSQGRGPGDPQILRPRLECGALLNSTAASIAAILKPAGLDKSKGLISASPMMDVTDPRWKDDPDVRDWKAFMDKYTSATEFIDGNAAAGYRNAALLVLGVQAVRERLLAREHHAAGGKS